MHTDVWVRETAPLATHGGSMSTPQLTADPDDALWDGPSGAPTAVALLEQPKRLLPPCCGECPPSLTAKRQKGKILQLLPFDLSVRPNAEGAWLCTTCPATYENRPELFGHVRFCEGQSVWSCEWCDAIPCMHSSQARTDRTPSTLSTLSTLSTRHPHAKCYSHACSSLSTGAVAASPRPTTRPTARMVRRRSARTLTLALTLP